MTQYDIFVIAITLLCFFIIYKTIQYIRDDYDDYDDHPDIDLGERTKQMPEISTDLEIPEEDQEYLLPLVVDVLKKLAYSKRAIPTNAMLLEHLSEALSQASQTFEPRKNNSEPYQTGNEDWLMVAAFAIRLYDEGTPHNCKEARDAFVTDGQLASRRVEKWAQHLNNQIADMVRKGVVGEDFAKDITSHVETVHGTPYTRDEVEDMKKSADERNKNPRK